MNKLDYIKNKLRDNGFELNELELCDLEIQLDRKGYCVYEKVIDFIIDNKIDKMYESIKNLIKLEKRFSNNLWLIMNSLEESFRAIIINDNQKHYQWEEYIKFMKEKDYYNLVENSNLSKRKKTLIHKIRKVRNGCAHHEYFIINKKVKFVLDAIKEVKKFNFINERNIDKLIDKLMLCNRFNEKNNYFEFYSKYFE